MSSKKQGAPAPEADPTPPRPGKKRSIEEIDGLLKKEYGPETKGPLTVHTATGQAITSNKAALHGCLSDLSRKVDCVTAVKVTRSKADAKVFHLHYQNNRKISDSNKFKLRRRMDADDWVVDGPTLSYDSNGAICDGGHTNDAFLGGIHDTLEFVVLLGIDPRLNTRTDTGMYRDLIAQAHYLGKGVLENITSGKEQRTFTTSVSEIFGMAADHGMWNIGLKFGDAKREVCQHEVGMALIEVCHKPFLAVRSMLDRVSVKDNDVLLFKRFIYYVPAIILTLAGYPNWPELLATGAESKNDPLSEGSRWLLKAANRQADAEEGSKAHKKQDKKPEWTTKREQADNKRTVHTLLAFAYCKATNVTVRTPLAHYKMEKDGSRRELDYDRKQTKEDNRYQKEIAAFFLNKINNPTETVKA